MKIDIEELKRLAEAATPGPWEYDYDDQDLDTCNGILWGTNNYAIAILPYDGQVSDEKVTATGNHIAAANPAAILALIAERDKLLARAEKAEQELAAERKRLDWELEKAATFYEWQGKHYLSYDVPENDGFDVIESTDPRATIDELIAGDAGEKK